MSSDHKIKLSTDHVPTLRKSHSRNNVKSSYCTEHQKQLTVETTTIFPENLFHSDNNNLHKKPSIQNVSYHNLCIHLFHDSSMTRIVLYLVVNQLDRIEERKRQISLQVISTQQIFLPKILVMLSWMLTVCQHSFTSKFSYTH